jgi:hypothetical protein
MKTISLVILALIGWALCGSLIAIGRAITTMEITLITHAILAPVIFYLLSRIYFSKYNAASPIQTAVVFLSIVVGMDFFIVSMLIEKNFAMFESFLGTWLPFILIFLAVWIAGKEKSIIP